MWVGAALAAVGYGGLFLAATGRLAVTYGGILALAFIAGNSSSWYDTATLVTNVSTCQRQACACMLDAVVVQHPLLAYDMLCGTAHQHPQRFHQQSVDRHCWSSVCW